MSRRTSAWAALLLLVGVAARAQMNVGGTTGAASVLLPVPIGPVQLQTLSGPGSEILMPPVSQYQVIPFQLTGALGAPWVLTHTPTIAPATLPGTIIRLQNVDPNTGNCAVLQDQTLLPNSGLFFGGETRTLCGGDPPMELIYVGQCFAGANANQLCSFNADCATNVCALGWHQQTGLEIFEGTPPGQDKGQGGSLHFDAGALHVTKIPGVGTVVATNANVPLFGSTLTPDIAAPEVGRAGCKICVGGSNPGIACPLGTECTGGGLCTILRRDFGKTGALNNWNGCDQTFSDLDQQTYAGSGNWSCHNNECTYVGLYANPTDLATRANVGAHVSQELWGRYSLVPSALGNNVSTAYFAEGGSTLATDITIKAPILTTCSTQMLVFSAIPANGTWDTNSGGSPITLAFNINKSSTPSARGSPQAAASATSSALQAVGTSVSYTGAQDYYSFNVACLGNGCSSTNTYGVQAKAICLN